MRDMKKKQSAGHPTGLIFLSTLSYKTVYEPQLGELHGLLTEFPSFIPKVRWTSDTTLEVSIYTEKLYTPEEQEAAIPTERRLISI
jgi:hypothetical protein